MQRSFKRGPSKHLEKMLFINHKEELMLDVKLTELNLNSRQRVIEMDLDRNRVCKEWRNSRKKNMTLNEAIAAGILPPEPMTVSNWMAGPGSQSRPRPGSQGQRSMGIKRPAASAPPRKKMAGGQGQVSRAATFFREPRGGRESIINSFPKQPAIPENEDPGILMPPNNIIHKKEAFETVGMYVLDEFDKVSQVVPDILRALAKKKEKYEEEEQNDQLAYDLKAGQKVDLMDYEPDMHKVSKTVSSVKQLRHRMAISKKLEVNKPLQSFDQMVKARADDIAMDDSFSDGISALMKRKLEKNRRNSASVAGTGERECFGRRLSLSVPSGPSLPRRMSSLPDLTQRRSSVFPASSTRGMAGIGFGSSPGKLDSAPGGLIDEDELINRQRILKELGKYQLLQSKVERFLIQRRPGSRTLKTVLEQITPIK